MRLSCIECGKTIPAGNINVQEMIAVCSDCDTVFRFELSDDKPKRRKMKAPERMIVHEDAPLHLSFSRVFGQEARSGLFGISFATFIFTVIVITTVGGFLAGDIPIFVPLLIGLLWSAGLYTVASLFFNTVTILNDGNQIRASHHPLPHPLQERDVAIDITAIQRIYLEQSYTSKRTGAAEKSFHIYIETFDGTRLVLLKGVPENYAMYIVQQINTQLVEQSADAVSRLEETPEENDVMMQDEATMSHEQAQRQTPSSLQK